MCSATIDSVIEQETWGQVHPTDLGSGDVTLHGTAMIDHFATSHTAEELLLALAQYYEERLLEARAGLEKLRGTYPQLFLAPNAPHSRACGIRKHDHGPDCHENCPTCGGKAAGLRLVGGQV